MATPYSPVPLGQAGSGEAFVLSSDPTALNILRQGEAARQRAEQLRAAAQQKQLAQDAKDYLDASKFNLEGGRIFQKGLTDVVAPQAQQRLMALYQDKSLTPMQRSMAAREIQNSYEGERQMTLQKQEFIDNFLKTKDDELNKDNIALGLAAAGRAQDGGLLRASQFDEEGVTNGLLAKADSYNAPVVVQNAIKGIQPAITEAVAYAGKVGGVHGQTTTTARFYDIDPQTGKVRTKDGQPVLNINDDSLALLKQNKRFNLLLEDRMARAKEQGVTLDEKKAAADLVGPYATYKETASAARNANAPTGGAAGKPKFTTTGGDTGSFGFSGFVTGNNSSEGFASAYLTKPIRRVTSTGKVEPYSANVVHQNLTIQIPGQPIKHLANNTDAAAIDYGSALVVLAKPDGSFIRPPRATVKDQQSLDAWMKKARATDPSLRLTYAIDGVASKGLNGIQDPKEIAAQLMAEAAANDRPISTASAEKQARQLLSRRDAKYWTLYEGTDKDIVDANTDGKFASQQAQMQRRLQQIDEATRPVAVGAGGSVYKKKGAANPADAAPVNRGGGVYKVKSK